MSRPKQQTQATLKYQTVDQEFAHNILFTTLSTMETLANKLRNFSGKHSLSLKAENKEFGLYDIHDYSYKEYQQLRGQLIYHVMLLAHSKRGFDSVYGTGRYGLPSNYDQQMAVSRLHEFKSVFQKEQNSDCWQLADDVEHIISKNKTKDLHYQKMKVSSAYFQTLLRQKNKNYQDNLEANWKGKTTIDPRWETSSIQSYQHQFSVRR